MCARVSKKNSQALVNMDSSFGIDPIVLVLALALVTALLVLVRTDAHREEFNSGSGGMPLKSSPASKVTGLAKTGPINQCYKDAIVLTQGTPKADMVKKMRTETRKYTIGDGKKMLAVSLDDAWPALKKYFEFEDWQKSRVLALFLGQATRESTLCIDVETGIGKGYGLDPAHAYGLLQTAVTAFKGAAQKYNYEDEDDVPEMKHYEWKPENFYDPMISNFLGFRKMCHFAIQARSKYNVKDKWEVLRLAIQAHNTGHANNTGNPDSYMANYPDNIARMGEFYFAKNHLTDDIFTWTDHFEKAWPEDPGVYPRPAVGAAWKDNWKWVWTK